MRIKLPQKPTFEIRCPNNLGVITLLLQGITPLQKWFPEATIRISATQNHHYWLKKLIPTIPLSTKNQKADYIITGKIDGPWYQHRWQSLINQFKTQKVTKKYYGMVKGNIIPNHKTFTCKIHRSN